MSLVLWLSQDSCLFPSLPVASCLSPPLLPPPPSSSGTLLSPWVCLSSVRASVWFSSLTVPWSRPASQNPNLHRLSHLQFSFFHKTLADLARRHIFTHISLLSPQIPYFPLLRSKNLNPLSNYLFCLDLKHKQVPLLRLIKGGKQGEGGALI